MSFPGHGQLKRHKKTITKKAHRSDNADDGVESGDLAKYRRQQILLSQLSQQTELKKFVKFNVFSTCVTVSNIEREMSTC